MNDWTAFNDRTFAAIEQGMSDYPPNLPFDVQQPARTAIQAYRAGDRDPELILFLASVVSSAQANVARYRLYQMFVEASNRFAS